MDTSGMPGTTRLLFEMHSRLASFQARVARAEASIADALAEMEKGYIAFSTGKDSLVMMHLVWAQCPDVPAVYFDADCAYPESYALLDRLEMQGRPVLRWQTEPLLETYARHGGLDAPTMESTVYAPIRALLIAHGFDGVFVGLRAGESEGRAKSTQFHGTLYRYKRDGVLRCLPVARWGYRDIWAYIVSRGLDYNRIYDRMWEMPEEDQRVSYWAGDAKRRWGRFVFLKQHYPALWNKFAAQFPEVREYC